LEPLTKLSGFCQRRRRQFHALLEKIAQFDESTSYIIPRRVLAEAKDFTLTPIQDSTPKANGGLTGRWHHAWDDRAGAAKELHDLLGSRGVSVWFSEKDVALGTPLLRGIDKGLAKSRVGIVLVTPALLRRLQGESIADKEPSVLLARDQLVPIVHGTTYEALREVSPLLGSRTGLSTGENPVADVAAKLAELVAL
jgi:TIR domain